MTIRDILGQWEKNNLTSLTIDIKGLTMTVNCEIEAKAPTFTVDRWAISKVIPYEKNPRINDDAVDAVADSIKQFGFRVPIVVDSDGVIVAGHTRLKAAQKLGLEFVPVHVAADLTADQARALRLADNKSSELAQWDYELLPIELNALRDVDFDLSSIGFDEEELAEILSANREDGQTDVETSPDTPEVPVSKSGEIYQLGNHRLLCGDTTNPELVATLMGNKKLDLIFSDPPYGVSLADKNQMLNAMDKGMRIQTQIENDHMSLEQTGELWVRAFGNWQPYLADHSSYYICTASSNDLLPLMINSMREASMPYRHQLIWVKNHMVLGRSDYNYRHEVIFYGWSDRHKFYGNGEQKETVWNYNRPHVSDLHPTMKPIELIENAILNSTMPGMLVGDLFMGSGSTIMAAERTGRIAVGAEIDPHYCDVIRKRWAQFMHGGNCDWEKLTTSIKEN